MNEVRVLILADGEWHTGLIGPVASRLVETYRKPAILIAHDGEIGRGSARTAGGFQLMTALDGCRDLMERCGGHQQAAGFDLSIVNLSAFEDRMHRLAREQMGDASPDDLLEIDAAIPTSEIGLDLYRELACLQPCGHGNPSPIFASRVTILAVKSMGKSNEHLKWVVRGEGMDPTEVVFWRQGGEVSRHVPGEEVLLSYRLGINRFSGYETVQLEGIDVKTEDVVRLPLPRADADPFATAA